MEVLTVKEFIKMPELVFDKAGKIYDLLLKHSRRRITANDYDMIVNEIEEFKTFIIFMLKSNIQIPPISVFHIFDSQVENCFIKTKVQITIFNALIVNNLKDRLNYKEL